MMTFKRFLFVLFFLGLIPVSCWYKDVPQYTSLGYMSVEAFYDESLIMPIADTDSISDSIIYFKLNSKVSYISSLPKLDLTNTSYAMTKPKSGYDGLKIKLSDIRITSDNLLNGNAVGTNLASYFTWIVNEFQPIYSTNEFKEELNDNSNYFYYTGNDYFTLVLKTKPTDSLSHRFTFDFIYVDGTVQSTTSEKLTWQ